MRRVQGGEAVLFSLIYSVSDGLCVILAFDTNCNMLLYKTLKSFP